MALDEGSELPNIGTLIKTRIYGLVIARCVSVGETLMLNRKTGTKQKRKNSAIVHRARVLSRGVELRGRYLRVLASFAGPEQC
jgi:hypothetical protein